MSTPTLPRLETERLIIRAPEVPDFQGFAEFLGSPRAAFIGGPFSGAMQLSRMFGHAAGMWVLRGYGTFILERRVDGLPIGHAGPWHPMHWPEPELGWCIWRDADEGQGLAFEAMRRIHGWVFGDLGWSTAVSYIDADNTRSAALARRLGAVRDESAPVPEGDDPAETHVFRHSKGAA